MRFDLHELERVHSAPNAQQGRQTRYRITTASRSNHESMCYLWQHIRRSSHRAESCCQLVVQRHVQHRSQSHDPVTGEVTQPISCDLCEQELGDLQTYHAHARLTHPALPSSDDQRESACPASSTRNRQHARNGHEREPRVHQGGRQLGRRGAAKPKAAPTNRQPNQARRRGQPLDNSGGQAQSRQQIRGGQPQQDHAQDAPYDARLILDGVGHSADQCVEPRSRQHAETDADLRRKGAARGARTHPRTTIRVGVSGPDRVSSAEGQHGRHANGTTPIDLQGPTENPSAEPSLRRGSMLQAGQKYKADIKRITLNIVSPENRLLVLEALGQTEAERKYGRAPPTAMERELQVFLEDLLKT